MSAVISREAAAREILRRDLACESLVGFSKAVEIPGVPLNDDDLGDAAWTFAPIETGVAKHHVVMMEAIERCIRTDYGRLMIFAPPGSAKSTYVGVLAPAWAMAMWPGFRVVSTSYADSPAHRSSKRVRQICRTRLYQTIWPDPVAPVRGEEAVGEWQLTNGSGLLAAGILGGITSARADLLIIDDPVAGREEADSEPMRRKILAAYEDDLATRLKPKASVILMQTRWHLDDLAGSILPEDYDGRSGPILCRDGQVWQVLNIQAQCERNDDPVGRKLGEYLWPEWFDPRHWRQYQSKPRTWNALYQGRPTIAEGGQFKLADFKRYTKKPKGCRWFAPGDWAVTKLEESTRPDFTQVAAVGIDEDGDLWFDHGFGMQDTLDKTVPAYLELCKAYKIKLGLAEKGVIEKALKAFLTRTMRDTGNYIAMEWLPTIGDKTAMAASFRALCAAGKVHVREGPWGNALIAQLCAFPYTTFDDSVDMAGLAGRYIDDLYAPRSEKKKRKASVKPFSAQMAEYAERESEMDAERREEFLG